MRQNALSYYPFPSFTLSILPSHPVPYLSLFEPSFISALCQDPGSICHDGILASLSIPRHLASPLRQHTLFPLVLPKVCTLTLPRMPANAYRCTVHSCTLCSLLCYQRHTHTVTIQSDTESDHQPHSSQWFRTNFPFLPRTPQCRQQAPSAPHTLVAPPRRPRQQQSQRHRRPRPLSSSDRTELPLPLTPSE